MWTTACLRENVHLIVRNLQIGKLIAILLTIKKAAKDKDILLLIVCSISHVLQQDIVGKLNWQVLFFIKHPSPYRRCLQSTFLAYWN